MFVLIKGRYYPELLEKYSLNGPRTTENRSLKVGIGSYFWSSDYSRPIPPKLRLFASNNPSLFHSITESWNCHTSLTSHFLIISHQKLRIKVQNNNQAKKSSMLHTALIQYLSIIMFFFLSSIGLEKLLRVSLASISWRHFCCFQVFQGHLAEMQLPVAFRVLRLQLSKKACTHSNVLCNCLYCLSLFK